MSREITQWEYTTFRDLGGNLKKCNELGKEGWEATGNTINGNILWKRPLQQQKTEKRDSSTPYPEYLY